MSPGEAAPTAAPETPAGPPEIAEPLQSAGLVRFRSCRWRQPKDETSPVDFCTHREVKPYAGTRIFDADAWCSDCEFYKLRRTPKKREPRDEYSY